MTRSPVLYILTCSLLLSCACSTPPKPKPMGPLVEAVREPDPVPAPKVIAVPYAQPVPGQAQALPPAAPTPEQIEQAQAQSKPVGDVLDEANERATQPIDPDRFVNAVQVYDYMAGAQYPIWGAPNHLTVIEFGPGETLNSFASGDTIRWQVAQTESGVGVGARQMLVVQPTQKGLHTTMLVTTNMGSYLFNLRSFKHSYLAGVRFRYPTQTIKNFVQKSQTQAQARVDAQKKKGLEVDLANLDSNYRFVVSGDAPEWAPTQVFTDGKRTFIEFPQDLGTTQVPSLFLLGTSKSARLVQYAIRGRYMIIPQKVRLAQLRLGKDSSSAVGIEYKGAIR